MRTTHSLSYDPFPANRVTETFNNDWPGSQCTASRSYFDGLGRLYAEQQWPAQLTTCPANSSSPAWPAESAPNGVELHTYSYDARSNLQSVQNPNPQNDASLVTTSFMYDSRGRMISSTAPDSATATASYPPFEHLTTDADGVVNHQYLDGFGALWSVVE